MSHLRSLLLLLLVVNIDSVQTTAPKSREQLTVELEKLSKKVEQLEAREGEIEKLGEKVGEALGEKLNEGIQKLQECITKLGEKQNEGMEKLGQELGEKFTEGLGKLGESQTCGMDEKETTPTTQQAQCQPATCPPCGTDQNAQIGFSTVLRHDRDSTISVQANDNPYAMASKVVLKNQGGGFSTTSGIFTAPVTGTYFFFFTAVSDGNFSARQLVGLRGTSSYSYNTYPESCDICATAGSTTQNLTAGQKVWVYSRGAGNLYKYATSFGGFLV